MSFNTHPRLIRVFPQKNVLFALFCSAFATDADLGLLRAYEFHFPFLALLLLSMLLRAYEVLGQPRASPATELLSSARTELLDLTIAASRAFGLGQIKVLSRKQLLLSRCRRWFSWPPQRHLSEELFRWGSSKSRWGSSKRAPRKMAVILGMLYRGVERLDQWG